MSAPVEIALAERKPEVLEGIAECHVESNAYAYKFYTPTKEEIKEKAEKWLADEAGVVLVAKVGKEVVGYIYATKMNHTIFEIKYLEVKSAWQRKGIGSALIKAAEHLAKQRGFKKLGLFTSRNNAQALNFYRKNGFRIHGFIAEYYSWGEAAVFLAKEL